MEEFENNTNKDEEIELEFQKKKKKMKKNFILTTILIALIVAVFSSEFTLYYYNKANNLEKTEASENADKNIDIIAENLKSFRTVIDQYYIGEIDEQKILDETIKGYVNGLDDEYSEYMTKEEWEEFQADALGNYVGIGIYMTIDENGNVVILSPIEGTPAADVGLKEGDVIVNVNEESVLGFSSDEVSSKIKGEEGTKVKITVLRNNEYLDFEVERKAIKVYHVESEMLDNKIGYISLLTFDEGCSEEFKNAYEKLASEGAEKLIIDLRSNTGGLVDEALNIADMILPKGAKMLITTDSEGNKTTDVSENDPIIINKDIVLLVNEYSASASELLVGALKDNGKAIVVGKNTYGKGVIQSVFMLNDGSALKLTVNEYFTPNETKINKVGIKPDYEVDLGEDPNVDTQLNKAIEVLNTK